jgi:hypothetical protein
MVGWSPFKPTNKAPEIEASRLVGTIQANNDLRRGDIKFQFNRTLHSFDYELELILRSELQLAHSAIGRGADCARDATE